MDSLISKDGWDPFNGEVGEELNGIVISLNKLHSDFNELGWHVFFEVRFDYDGEVRSQG